MQNKYVYTEYKKKKVTFKLKSTLVSLVLTAFFMLFAGFPSNSNKKIQQKNINYQVVQKPAEKPNDIKNTIHEKYEVKTIRSGDSYGKILGKMKFESQDIFLSAASLGKVFKPEKLRIGDKMHVYYTENINEEGEVITRNLNKVRVEIDNFENEYEVAVNLEGKYVSGEVSQELVMKPRLAAGSINTSIYQDAIKVGVPPAIIADFTNVYSFDLDFQRDIHKNDQFKIFFEAYYDERGKFVKAGKIIYSEYKSKKLKRDIKNYRYQTTKGSIVYLDPEGQSVKRSLLLTPINGARISSNYGLRRHPILGYTKMHKGVDFAAPRGTPIYAAGNGKIVRIGWNGGYGKYIAIRHNQSYSTAYAHMSKFKTGLKKGSFVKQGDVIGYVGTTGRSTGPHLHYEVLKSGKQINPRNIKSKSKIKLYGKELANFSEYKERVDFIMYNAYASLMQ